MPSLRGYKKPLYNATYAEDHRPAIVKLRAAIEALWLIAAFLVPILILPDRAMVFVESPKVALLRGIAVIMLGLMVWEWALTPRLPAVAQVPGFTARMGQWVREGPSQWVLGAAVLFLAAYVLSALLSPVPGVSIFGREPGRDSFSLYSIATSMVLFFAVATHLRRPEQLQRLMWAIVASALVVSAYGIGQRWDFEPIREVSDGIRVRSSFGNPLFFGSFLVMTMPLTLTLMLWATRNLQALPRVLVVAAPVTVQMTALLFTLSRGPWIGIAFAMTAMAIVLGLTAGRRLVAILGAVVAIAVVVGYLATLIPSHNSSSESVGRPYHRSRRLDLHRHRGRQSEHAVRHLGHVVPGAGGPALGRRGVPGAAIAFGAGAAPAGGLWARHVPLHAAADGRAAADRGAPLPRPQLPDQHRRRARGHRLRDNRRPHRRAGRRRFGPVSTGPPARVPAVRHAGARGAPRRAQRAVRRADGRRAPDLRPDGVLAPRGRDRRRPLPSSSTGCRWHPEAPETLGAGAGRRPGLG